MAIDIEEPESPGWWLNVLATKLHERRSGRDGKRQFSRRTFEPSRVTPGLVLLSDYLRGDPPLREDIHSDWAIPFRQFLRMGRMNVAPKLVSSITNRMAIRDFRTAAADDELGDAEARNLMRLNKLRVRSREVHDFMCGLGYGYTIVTPPDGARDWSLITSESPMECITAHDPATGEELAGLKMFRDSTTKTDWAFLFLPGEVWVAVAEVQSSTLWRPRWAISKQWEWATEKFDDVPGNKVAMVRFRNKDGRSEIEGALDTLDRINDKLFNEWWIGKIQAFRQRALEMPDDEEVEVDNDEDEDGVVDHEDLAGIFTSSPDALWQLPKGAKIWESQETNLEQLTKSIKAELEWLAFTESKPLYLITPDAANGSAEGATTQREEHVFVVEDRQDRASDGWAKTMSLAFEFQGETDRADVTKIEPLWAPAERYSLEQKADAATKYKGAGVPVEAVLTDVLQYSPADVVDRLRPLRNRDLLYAAPAGQQQAPPPADDQPEQ